MNGGLVRAIVGVILIALVVIWTADGPGKPGPTRAEARTAAVLQANVMASHAAGDWYLTLQQVDGRPNIQIGDQTAFVFTTIPNSGPGKTTATTVCWAVAGDNIDPSTAHKLEVWHIKVYGGSTGLEQLASCDEP